MPPFCWLCLREFGPYERQHLVYLREGPHRYWLPWPDPAVWRGLPYRRRPARMCTDCWTRHGPHKLYWPLWPRPQWAT